MLHPTVFNTSQICFQLGVRHAVMSPGSRNAPLTLSFARNKNIQKWIIPDERAAGFIALGIADETKTPVVLCCTSGSALLNYAPAVAEAYYREIPLIILSADRPPELIDQRDGQTIRQFEALRNHVKESYRLPLVSSKSEAGNYQNELVRALNHSQTLPLGPVHINIPFVEPFYPDPEQALEFEEIDVKKSQYEPQVKSEDIDLTKYRKVLLLIGQHDYDQELDEVLKSLVSKVPIIKSPLNNLSSGIDCVDGFISNQDELKPDLLITSGLSVLSKKLKLFLRKHKPARHLHFDLAGVAVDTFQSSPELLKNSLKTFLHGQSFDQIDSTFVKKWEYYSQRASEAIETYLSQANFSEVNVAKHVLDSIPSDSILHLSNSMPVRYADLLSTKNLIQCKSNRGTSGIDGCTSTAVGNSLVSEDLVTLLTGDLAFLYDRNAFFHNYPLPNLRVIVLNNQGGGIFRLIDGPSRQPELEEYFETRHNRTAEYICAENGFEYLKADDEHSLVDHLEKFYQASQKAKVLEVFIDPEINQRVFKELKLQIDERIKH